MDCRYVCSECGAEYPVTPNMMLCPACSAGQEKGMPLRGVLEVRCTAYDDEETLLPVEREFFPSIPVGNTPLWEPENLRRETGFPNLYLKDDTLNPTGSLKDRASFLVSAFARKHGITDVTVASTGNAASSMAGVGAAAGLNVKIFIPASAPKAKMVQAVQYGAGVTLVDGPYDHAFAESLAYTREHGGINRNTAYNPMTIEGKKTAAVEICRQLGGTPDFIFVPTGDGVIISGVYKGLKDLLARGRIDRMPAVFCVQAEGSAAITRAFESGGFSGPFQCTTLADSISVGTPAGGLYALAHLQKYDGRCVTVTDAEILDAQHRLARLTGLFAEPSSSAALAGFEKIQHDIPKDARVVLLITGSGLKDIDNAMKGVTLP